MNFLSLRYFIEIANHLSFSEASKNLHISQPGLSQQIFALENQLGFRLFNRTTRKVTLTEEGEYIYKRLAASFEDIESTIGYLVENKIIPKPKIKIATVPSAASIYIPNLMKKVMKKFPEAEFYLHETTSSGVIDFVNQQNYHFGFIRTPIHKNIIEDDGLNMIEFKRYPLQLIVSANHPLAQNDSIDLIEAKNEAFIHYDANQAHSLQFLLEKACLTAGFSPQKLCIGSELLTIVNLVSNNLGVALVPQDMVGLLDTDKIKAINIDNNELSSSISVVWKATQDSSFLTDHILTTLQNDPSFYARQV